MTAPTLLQPPAVIAVTDLTRSIAFYEKFGFTRGQEYDADVKGCSLSCGSAVLFHGIYSRLLDADVVVLTDRSRDAAPEARDGHMRIVRRRLATSRWGLLDVRGLAHHLAVARDVRRLMSRRHAVVQLAPMLDAGGRWVGRQVGDDGASVWPIGHHVSIVVIVMGEGQARHTGQGRACQGQGNQGQGRGNTTTTACPYPFNNCPTTTTQHGRPKPIIVLVGILGDKDWRSMLRALSTVAAEIVATVPPSAPGPTSPAGERSRCSAPPCGGA